jgi:hypothetical protein
MSDAHSHSGKAGGAAGTRDLHDMKLGRIVIVGAVSLCLFTAGIFWAYQLMVGRMADIQAGGPARVPTEIGKPEIGIVDQVPFEIDHRLEIWRAARAKHLSTYGWTNRGKGIAHMPIEKAIQQVIASPPDIAGEGVSPVAHMPAVPPALPGVSNASPGRTP